MTFPLDLIASIQFVSGSHARPQRTKYAVTKKSLSCNNLLNQRDGIMGKTNFQLHPKHPNRKQAKA